MQSLTNAVTIQTGSPRSGSYLYRAASNVVSAIRVAITTVDNRTYWMGMGFKISTASPSTATRILVRNDYDIRITTSRTLEVRVGGVLIGSASAALTLGQWYYIELAMTANSAGNDYVEGWLDGVSFASSSGSNLSTLLGNNFDFGPNTTAYGATVVMEMDDMYITDDQNSAPVNTRLNQPKIVTSLPTSDTSRDAGWTDNDNTTSNLFQSVDNRPPVAVAPASGAGSADLEIKNAASTTTDNVVFAMQSADTVGIDSNDTIIATQLVCTHGLSSATSTTSTSQQIVANDGHPGTSEENFDANAASGTWPTGWIVGRTLTENPSVTDRTVSPSVEIGKRTATTRVVGVGQVRIDWIYLPVTATDWEQPVDDSVTTSDGATPEVGRTASPADSVTPSDALTFERGLVQPDTVALADALTFEREIHLDDSVTPSDAVAFEFSVTIADSVTPSDSATAERGLNRQVDDTVGLADELTSESGQGVSPEDTVTLTDTVAFERAITIPDTLALSDGLAFERAVQIDDTLALTDGQTLTGDRTLPLADTVDLADTVAFERAITVDDTVALGDDVDASKGVDQTVQVDDGVSLADALAARLTRGAGPVGYIDLPDTGRFSTINGGTVAQTRKGLVTA